MKTIEPPEGYEWCTLDDADRRDGGTLACCWERSETAPTLVAKFLYYGEESGILGFIRKKPPELPQGITGAGWGYAASWHDAQGMGVDPKGGGVKRAAWFASGPEVIGACFAAEYSEDFVCWLRVTK